MGSETVPTPTAVRAISKDRFDAFVGYCRLPEAATVAHEIAWFGADDNSVFALMIVGPDREFFAIVFLPDLHKRFRWVNQTDYFSTAAEAGAALERLLKQLQTDFHDQRVQGDEVGTPVDFFAPRVADDRLHANFKLVRDSKGYSPARDIINVMMRWYEDRDGNFIEQFQTDGFDPRIWELYLWATLISLDYEVSQPKPSPDFVARGLRGSFAIEATTINPSFDKFGNAVPSYKPASELDVPAYLDHYLPIRFAGPLTAKLKKRYWERPGIGELPLVFAIQDFHARFSMMDGVQGLVAYLYGISVSDATGAKSSLRQIVTHTWRDKAVPSGFFRLPDSENVSAVIFNSQGTLSKFSRMGVKAGFAHSDVTILHSGMCLSVCNDTVVETQFTSEVGEDYWEKWITGMSVFHNPHALSPLNPDMLPGAAHCIIADNGDMETIYPDRHIAYGYSAIIASVKNK